MARCRYIPEREPSEPRYGKGDEDFKRITRSDPDVVNVEEWEFQSVANFVEFLADEDRTTYTTAELISLASRTGIFNTVLRVQLERHGLSLVGSKTEAKFRTFGDNPHDRWSGPGSSPCHGGGGGDQIMGLAGTAG
jgi:hypothetical protein